MKRVIHGNLLIRAAICGFILAVLFSFTGFSAQCDLLVYRKYAYVMSCIAGRILIG